MSVTITVKRVGGETVSVSVPAIAPSVGLVYDAISQELGIPKDRIRVIFKGQSLARENGSDLANIGDGDTGKRQFRSR